MTTMNLEIKKGLPFYKVFRYETKVGNTNTPVNLTNAVIEMQVRHTPANPKVLFEFIQDAHVYVSNPSTGEITINLSDEVTSGLNFRFGVFSVNVKLNGSNSFKEIVDGEVKVTYSITR